jgi:benzoyl-CoA 2,3-dioxygenase component B
MQLESLAQSGFDPLARTARFMLTEEAHHMFVGQSGIARIVERTCSAMFENGLHDPYDVERIRALGVIDLPTVQRKLNFHFSVSLDLFGSEISTNAAGFFDSGIKGRYREAGIKDDHQLITATYPVLKLEQGHIKSVDAAAMPALNARLRDDYARECARGVDRWNTIIGKTDIPFTLSLPHVAFSRAVGEFGGTHADPQGHILTDDEWDERKHRFLPTVDDQAYLNSLMIPVLVPGEFAPWITPPGRPIDDKPSDFRYAKLNS